jgi:DNA mismatch endonuclease (patch repair protein)
MQAIRSRDTKPELAVRRLVHAAGLRYRVAFRPLPSLRRTADLVFTKRHVAVFIDGCFWHCCPEHGRPAFRENPEYWAGKLARNQARDIETDKTLAEAGWQVLRFWEHQSPGDIADTIIQAVRAVHKQPDLK